MTRHIVPPVPCTPLQPLSECPFIGFVLRVRKRNALATLLAHEEGRVLCVCNRVSFWEGEEKKNLALFAFVWDLPAGDEKRNGKEEGEGGREYRY